MSEREFWLVVYRDFVSKMIGTVLKEMIIATIRKLLREEVREDDWMWFTACQERTS